MPAASQGSIGRGSPHRGLGRCLRQAVLGLLLVPAGVAVRAESPVFDDDALNRGFLRGLVAVGTGDGVLTGETVLAEAARRVGAGVEVTRRAGEAPVTPVKRQIGRAHV